MEALKKNKKIFFNIGLLVIFVWLLITSYSQSKRKPDNIGELLNDFSWLGGKWPKWLDLPLMNWINSGFKTLNEKYGYCLLYTSPSPRDVEEARMPSSA